jgi:predicted aldo/keto reductase-like oxidoreductase
MEMRVNKKDNSKVSLLGFGMMRLPKVTPDKQEIDKPLAKKMVDYAIANGVNYFDTAYPYHEGLSELFTGEALKDYPRDSFYLATKMPTWLVKSLDDAKRIFAEQLKKLQVEYFDYYLLHALGSYEDFENAYLKTGALDYFKEEQKNGRIRNLGFSFHGSVPVLEKLMAYSKWDFVQLQLNYQDWDVQNAKREYEILCEHDTPCVVMEPVRGGNLVTLNKEAVDILKAAEPEDSTAAWALRFAGSLPNVLTVLSGMSAMEHVVDNVKTMTNWKPLDDAGMQTLERAITAYLSAGTIACTGCRYCMDCPSGVDIPKVFELYNVCAAARKLPISVTKDAAYDEAVKFFNETMGKLPEENRAHNCTDCGACVERCPQSLKINRLMDDIMGIAESIAQ